MRAKTYLITLVPQFVFFYMYQFRQMLISSYKYNILMKMTELEVYEQKFIILFTWRKKQQS